MHPRPQLRAGHTGVFVLCKCLWRGAGMRKHSCSKPHEGEPRHVGGRCGTMLRKMDSTAPTIDVLDNGVLCVARVCQIDIDGDASFSMTCAELITAAQYKIPVKVCQPLCPAPPCRDRSAFMSSTSAPCLLCKPGMRPRVFLCPCPCSCPCRKTHFRSLCSSNTIAIPFPHSAASLAPIVCTAPPGFNRAIVGPCFRGPGRCWC